MAVRKVGGTQATGDAGVGSWFLQDLLEGRVVNLRKQQEAVGG